VGSTTGMGLFFDFCLFTRMEDGIDADADPEQPESEAACLRSLTPQNGERLVMLTSLKCLLGTMKMSKPSKRATASDHSAHDSRPGSLQMPCGSTA
jgi:hypothetical protein